MSSVCGRVSNTNEAEIYRLCTTPHCTSTTAVASIPFPTVVLAEAVVLHYYHCEVSTSTSTGCTSKCSISNK